MNTLYTKEELIQKGIKRPDVVRLIKSTERICNYFFKLHTSRRLSVKEQKEWDCNLSKWDHFKATLNKWDEK